MTLGDQDTNFQASADGTSATFELTLTNSDGTDEPLTFTSTLGEDGTITNTFVYVTDQHVDKFWEEPEGTFTQFPPTREGARPPRPPSCCTRTTP